MIQNQIFNDIVKNSNPAVRLINLMSADLCDRGYLNFKNRPRRKVFNIETAQSIRHNPALSIKNRAAMSVKKTKTGDLA